MSLLASTVRKLHHRLAAFDITYQLGEPPYLAMDRDWRAAISATRFWLVPAKVRNNLRVVCDVGANQGEWSVGVLRLARPQTLVAVEPIPEVFARLRSRLASYPAASCINAAAGASPAEVTLHVEAMSALSSVRKLSDRGREIHEVRAPSSAITVKQVTVDDILSSHDEVSLLKIDVQGYEREVLIGSRSTLSRCRCLFIELLYEPDYYDGALRAPELISFIEGMSPLRLSCVSEPGLAADGRGAWADAVFLNPSRF